MAVGPAQPRTLTETLRRWTVDDLEKLLSARPDLAAPLPRDLVEVSIRASNPSSVGRALDRLDAFLAQVALALAALPPATSVSAVADLLGVERGSVARGCAELRQLALLWGPDERLHVVRGVRECLGPYPGGLAPPSPNPLSEEEIARRLSLSDPAGRPILDRLLWSPAGHIRGADRAVDAASARSPLEHLLARGLLRPLDADTVLLPREVALHLRGGRFAAEPVLPTPPSVPSRPGDPERVDRAAAGAAFELVHDLELAIEALERGAFRVLRDGGLASRDLTGLARRLGLDTPRTGFLLEVGAATGLLAGDPIGRLLPTGGFDAWAHRHPAERWERVVRAWLACDRRFARGAEPGGHVLGPEADSPGAAIARTLVLELAAVAGAGAGLAPEDLVPAVAWRSPRLARIARPDLLAILEEVWREATRLGLVSLGAVSSYGVALGTGQELPHRLRELFPAVVDQVLIQADLTAVATGPLPTATARELRLLADQESRGGGGVFRFSTATLRRAVEAGWSAAALHDWLARHSSTGVPQPLSYLVDDVARTPDRVRVGFAGSFVRAADPAVAAALLSSPAGVALGLREIAPGVLVSLAEPDDVAGRLRALGHPLAVEDEAGQLATGAPLLRAPAASADHGPPPPSARAAAEAALAGERIEHDGPAPVTEAILEQLESATATARPVRIGYVTEDGAPRERELSPLDLGHGSVRGIDRQTARIISIPLARISSVRASSSAP